MENIQTLWVGSKLSKIEILCLMSFLHNGHNVHLYCYEDIKNIPQEIKIMDANEIVVEKEIFRIDGSYAAFSDLFRHKLLFSKGGYWVDTDVVCLKHFDFKSTTLLCGEDPRVISAGVMKLPKGNLLSKKVLNNYQKPLEVISRLKENPSIVSEIRKSHKGAFNINTELYKYAEWGELGGPMALTKICEDLNLQYNIVAPETFYPISWKTWWSAFYDPNLSSKIHWDNCYGIHLWNTMFSTYPYFDKESAFPKNTIINNLMKKYKVG